MKSKILIYGASGYMGKLFTRYAKSLHLPIVLGSRSTIDSKEEQRVFSLEDVNTIIRNLHDIKLVVNLAGPFSVTQQNFLEACTRTKTHYIDIAGEAREFESAYAFNEQAKANNIMIMPGAGFGVVPTDIAATLAHHKLPDATHLSIAYLTIGGASRGTLKTVLKDINREGIIVEKGKAVSAMPATKDWSMSAGGKKYRVVLNPWRGDLFTARLSTNIPNIQTFSNFPSFVESMMKGKLLWLRDLLLNRLIGFLPEGPSEKALQKGKTFVYAEVRNAKNESAYVSIQGPEAYAFTAQTLGIISREILQDNWKPGFQTPAIYGESILNSPFNNITIE